MTWKAPLILLFALALPACTTWEDEQPWDDDDDTAMPDDDASDDDAADDDASDDDGADDDVADDDAGDDDTGSTEDQDGDGVSPADGDCDDTNATVYPGAPEQCDGLDNDCDGAPDPDEVDGDFDGWIGCAGDCDDTNADVNPAQDEIPNDGLDNDCDGTADPTWIEIWPNPDPSGDHGGYIVDLAMHEYNQQGSLLSFRTTSHVAFDDDAAMIDMYVDNGTDVYTLTFDNDNPNPDALQLWSDSNAWAAPLSNPPSLYQDDDASDSIILGVDLAELGLGGMDEVVLSVAANLTGGGVYDDEFPDSGGATVALGPTAAFTLDGVDTFEVTGNGDGYIDSGEIWHVEVDLTNVGNLPATGLTGTLLSTSDVTVIIGSTSFGTVLPADTATNTPWFRIAPEPTASGVEIVPLELTDGSQVWTVGVEIPVGWGFETPAYETWDYEHTVVGSSAAGQVRVGVLSAGQVEQCYHMLAYSGDYAYGTNQGGWWPNEADTTIEFTNITDTGQGTCPAGYHDLYNNDPNELLLNGTTVLAFISCDLADGSFHGDDILTGSGTGTELSWCNDVGPVIEGVLSTGPAEAIALMVTSYGGMAGSGTFTYYISGDGNYYWAHMGMLMEDAANLTDPLYGMNGDYVQTVTWIFII